MIILGRKHKFRNYKHLSNSLSTRTDYRLCAGIMLFSRTGKIWVGQRIDTPNAWQMPQGGINENEEPSAAAIREIQEEIGSDNVRLLSESKEWLTYDLPLEIATQIWNGKYKGQKQKWFAFLFLGEDNEIDVHEVDEPEFQSWRWVDATELVSLAIDFKRPVYEAVVSEFYKLSQSLSSCTNKLG